MSILWNFDKYAKIEELPFDPAYISGDYLTPVGDVELLLKAGTPLVESSGVVAPLGEDDDPTCFAAEDYHFILTNAQQPNLVKCVTKGYVEQAKVLAAAGLESVPDGWADALAALGLYLVDELGNLPGGAGDPGYSVETETTVIIPEQTVTPTQRPGGGPKYAGLALAEGVEAAPETLSVVINGDEYELTAQADPGGAKYSLPDESASLSIGAHPVTGVLSGVFSCGDSFPGTVTISATTSKEVVTVTDEFKKAVAKTGGSVFIVNAEFDDEVGGVVCDKTWQQISDVFNGDGTVTVIDVIDYNSSTGGVMRQRAFVLRCNKSELGYRIETTGSTYICANADSYPAFVET